MRRERQSSAMSTIERLEETRGGTQGVGTDLVVLEFGKGIRSQWILLQNLF